MGTNAVISIVKDGKTIVKIIAGCEGKNAEATTTEIIKYMQIGDDDSIYLPDLYEICMNKEFGCKDCLVVMDKDEILFKGWEEEVSDKYRETFSDPQYNPRTYEGTVEYLFIIPVLE